MVYEKKKLFLKRYRPGKGRGWESVQGFLRKSVNFTRIKRIAGFTQGSYGSGWGCLRKVGLVLMEAIRQIVRNEIGLANGKVKVSR